MLHNTSDRTSSCIMAGNVGNFYDANYERDIGESQSWIDRSDVDLIMISHLTAWEWETVSAGHASVFA